MSCLSAVRTCVCVPECLFLPFVSLQSHGFSFWKAEKGRERKGRCMYIRFYTHTIALWMYILRLYLWTWVCILKKVWREAWKIYLYVFQWDRRVERKERKSLERGEKRLGEEIAEEEDDEIVFLVAFADLFLPFFFSFSFSPLFIHIYFASSKECKNMTLHFLFLKLLHLLNLDCRIAWCR